jgi:Tripartite tricarboxylate transporter TctB family
MPAFIRNPKDFWTGLVFIGFGIAFLLIAGGYPLGSARRMGPAYFPTILSCVLMLIGLAATVRSFFGGRTELRGFALQPMALIAFGTVLFGLLVRDAGLVVSIVLLVMISAFASSHFNWRTAAMLAVGMTVFCVGIFVYGLGLAIPIFGPLFGG